MRSAVDGYTLHIVHLNAVAVSRAHPHAECFRRDVGQIYMIVVRIHLFADYSVEHRGILNGFVLIVVERGADYPWLEVSLLQNGGVDAEQSLRSTNIHHVACN